MVLAVLAVAAVFWLGGLGWGGRKGAGMKKRIGES